MATRSFSPSRTMGIPSQDSEAFWESEYASDPATQTMRPPNLRTTGRNMLFAPERGYSARPLMATHFDHFGNQFAQFEAEQDLANLDAQKDILSGSFDPFSDEGQQKRIDYGLRGVISPQQEGMLRDLEQGPPQNKYSPVAPDVVRAASKLDKINPADPKAWELFTKTMEEIDADPDLAGTSVKAHPFFTDKAENIRQNILMFRPRGEDAMDARTWFAMKGGNPDDFDSGMFLDAQGNPDRAKMAYHLTRMKQANLSNDESDMLQLAADELGPMTESRLRSAYESAFDEEPTTPEQWAVAHQLAVQESAPQRKALHDIIRDLEMAGRSVPPRFKELLAGTPAQQAAQGAPPTADDADVPMVSTPAELEALKLPPGSRFRTPDGKVRMVKKKSEPVPARADGGPVKGSAVRKDERKEVPKPPVSMGTPMMTRSSSRPSTSTFLDFLKARSSGSSTPFIEAKRSSYLTPENFAAESAKAESYNVAQGLPSTPLSNWHRSVPLVEGDGAYYNYGDGRDYVGLGQKDSPKVREHEFTHAGQLGKKEIEGPIRAWDAKSFPDFSGILNQVRKEASGNDGMSGAAKSLLPTLEHDLKPEGSVEMRAYLSDLQNRMMSSRGKRIETPEEAKAMLQEAVARPHQVPMVPDNLTIIFRELSKRDPQKLGELIEYLSKIAPGIVSADDKQQKPIA